jgi:hypothetical protein
LQRISCDKPVSFDANHFDREPSLSFRDTDTATTAHLVSAVSIAGSFIRYAFYLFGMIVFAIVACALIWGWSNRVRIVDDKPALRLTDGTYTRLPTSSEIISGGKTSYTEVLRYGSLNSRTNDLTVATTLPRSGNGQSQAWRGLHAQGLLTDATYDVLSTRYDLETRYGKFHAVDIRINVDGRKKQCLSFSSRFETTSIFMTGWACDGSSSGPSASTLACSLDRIVIDKALPTKEADDYLRERMARPGRCSAEAVTPAFDTRSRPVSPPSRWSQPSSKTRL